MNYVSTHTYDDQSVRWLFDNPIVGRMLSVDNFVQDPTNTQNYNRYSYVLNNPLKYTDPSGEAIKLVFAVKTVVKVIKAFKLAAKTVKASKTAAVLSKSLSKKAINTGLKSGSFNTISNYNSDDGLGWNTFGDFAAGFAGGAFGYGTGSKLIGMGIGGLGTWGVNGARFDYKGAQEFVGGSLSSYVGMGKAVKEKHLLSKKMSLNKLDDANMIARKLKKYGKTFLKYGLQNNAYDFAYSKQKDFMNRGWGHLELFAWGGVSGVYQQRSSSSVAKCVRSPFGAQLGYQAVDWTINGWIKNRYDGIKVDYNKATLSYLKWSLGFYGLGK